MKVSEEDYFFLNYKKVWLFVDKGVENWRDINFRPEPWQEKEVLFVGGLSEERVIKDCVGLVILFGDEEHFLRLC